MQKLKTFTVRWSPERLEENVIEGVKAERIVSDYEVEDGFGNPILVPGEGRIHGQIAITPGPDQKRRVEKVMLECAKGIEKILTAKGMFDPAPTVKRFGLDVKEG